MQRISLEPLKTFQPNIEQVAQRWDAFWLGELIDRPLFLSVCPKTDAQLLPADTYRSRAFDPIDPLIDRVLYNASQTYYGGDSLPVYWPSFAPDELAAYCGATIVWPEDGPDTNWAQPFVQDWEASLPLTIDKEGYFFTRMQQYYARCAERLGGRVLLRSLDFHSNLDLLSAVRASEQLCLDLIDCPEQIDRAIQDARIVFSESWQACAQAGRMDEFGYITDGFSTNASVGTLSCDFICLIGKEMFRRWALPTMEYEAQFMDHVALHWDGPDALRHFDDLMGFDKLALISYVPSPGQSHLDYLALYQRIQAKGKAILFSGTTDQIKKAFFDLDPVRTIYCHQPASVADSQEMESWLKAHT